MVHSLGLWLLPRNLVWGSGLCTLQAFVLTPGLGGQVVSAPGCSVSGPGGGWEPLWVWDFSAGSGLQGLEKPTALCFPLWGPGLLRRLVWQAQALAVWP